MLKRLFSLCIAMTLLSASIANGQVASKKKTVNEITSELDDTKKNAVLLVKEFIALNPNQSDLNLLRKYYTYAKDSYLEWSQEAADAVEHSRKIDLGSKKAKNADSRLKEFTNFAKDYINEKEKEAKANPPMTLSERRNIWNTIKQIAIFINKHWDKIEAVRKWIIENGEEAKKQRLQIAKAILDAGNWPKFDDIKLA